MGPCACRNGKGFLHLVFSYIKKADWSTYQLNPFLSICKLCGNSIMIIKMRAALFMPIRFMPTDSCPPIHAHFFHARSYSCPTLFMPTRTYSCRNLFMPRLIHAMKIQKQIPMDYSCQDMAKTYSCPNWFMPQRASSCLDFSCPCLFMPVLH